VFATAGAEVSAAGVLKANEGVLVVEIPPPVCGVNAAAVWVPVRISTMIWGWVATGNGISLVGVAAPPGALVAGLSHALRASVAIRRIIIKPIIFLFISTLLFNWFRFEAAALNRGSVIR
jgi:hypothetical protein